MLPSNDELLSTYLANTIRALDVLYQEKLYLQSFVIFYSAIDSVGFLDSQPGQKRATQASFNKWVNSYLLKNSGLAVSAADLYSARCALLHTSSQESEMSRDNIAKQVNYYSGSRDGELSKDFESRINGLEGNSDVAVNIEHIYAVFYHALHCFKKSFMKKCLKGSEYESRLQMVVQLHTKCL